MLKQDMPIAEFKRYKNFVTQLYKAGLFFKFCEQNPCFSIYLSYFYKEKKVSDWNEYLCSVLSFYVAPIRQNTRNSIIQFRETDIKSQKFLEQFILDVGNLKLESDFGALRNNFVLKITNDEYMILNYNLLVDKIYQGLQFDFYNTLIKNGALNKKGKKIKDFGEYKSMLGDEFSETYLFYKIIERVVENKNYIKLSGEEIKGKTGNGEPDYYIRDNNNLFLFEMKDVIINKDIKLSDEIKVIHDGICSKICKDNGKERKGGGQLLYNIDRFYKNFFISLDDCNPENISAYPIIVVNDSAFDANGVSNLLFREFDKILDSKYPHLREKVNKPVLINLDALIYLLPHFKDNSITLSRIIKRYISEFENNPLLKYRSFTDFVLETYSDKMYDMKDLLKSLLFPEIKLEEEKSIKMRKEKHKSSKKRKSAIKRRRERKRNRKRRKRVR
ncbi:hypothetical protein AGMMS4957_04460 [Bacteroidia bacterium]|nr:hypothetical protein AGMMS4957_04460 [Bacteroidia bacterium]